MDDWLRVEELRGCVSETRIAEKGWRKDSGEIMRFELKARPIWKISITL